MKAFLKENIVLVAGISLPVALALVFMIATQIQQIGSEPPKHKLVFATEYYKQTSYNHYPYRFIVDDNTITLNYTPHEKNNWNGRMPKLFVFDPLSNSSTEIEIPEIEDFDKEAKILLTGIPEGDLITTSESPDGFTFDRDHRGGGNLMTEMFGGGYSSRSYHVLRKNGYRIRVPQSKYYQTELVAWIKSDD